MIWLVEDWLGSALHVQGLSGSGTSLWDSLTHLVGVFGKWKPLPSKDTSLELFAHGCETHSVGVIETWKPLSSGDSSLELFAHGCETHLVDAIGT